MSTKRAAKLLPTFISSKQKNLRKQRNVCSLRANATIEIYSVGVGVDISASNIHVFHSFFTHVSFAMNHIIMREENGKNKWSVTTTVYMCIYGEHREISAANIIQHNMTACGSTNRLLPELKIEPHMIWLDGIDESLHLPHTNAVWSGTLFSIQFYG